MKRTCTTLQSSIHGPAHKVDFRLYRSVSFAWSLVFLVVGLSFLSAPETAANGLTSLGHFLSLEGVILMPRESIGYVLALSLMSVITVLAYVSARDPKNTLPYYALLLSKIVSTLAFGYLAWRVASIWMVCAAADLVVALSLFGARHVLYKTLLPLSHYHRKLKGQSPFYEVWFGKLDLADGKAFWFRYSLLNGIRQESAVWGLLFDGDQIYAGKAVTPLSEARGHDDDVFCLNSNYLNRSQASGEAGPLRWRLEWEDSMRRFSHGPKLFKKLGLLRSRYESCFLDLRFSGAIQLSAGKDSADFKFKNATGMIGHIWGTRHADAWVWVHCNHFKGATDVVFEGLSVSFPIGEKRVRPFSSFVLYVDGYPYCLNALSVALRARSLITDKQWRFSVEQGAVCLSGEACLPEKTALVEYTNTDDGSLFCQNSKLASLKLHVIDRKRGIDRIFEAEDHAAFEIVNRKIPNHEDVTI